MDASFGSIKMFACTLSKPAVLNNFLHGRIPNPPDPSCDVHIKMLM